MSDPLTPEFADRPPWTKPGFIAAAALIALVVAAGMTIALWPSPDSPQGAPPTTSTTASGGDGGTSRPTQPRALETAVPTVAPADVTWQLVGLLAVPVSKSAGPSRIGATAAGYAHTPTGALIAAQQLSSRADLSLGRVSWEPTIIQQFVPSADRDRLLAGLRAAPVVRTEPGELSQIAGFRFVTYSPEVAVIGLVNRSSTGDNAYDITTVTMNWRDGDWWMVAPPGGQWTSIRQGITDLSGVVEWGPR